VRYLVTHRTQYTYGQPVSVCHNLLHLRPRELPTQACLGTTLTIDPPPALLEDRLDGFGNPTTFAIVQQVHRELCVEAVSEVDVAPSAVLTPEGGQAWEVVRDGLRTQRGTDALARYALTFESPMVQASDALREYAAPSFPAERPLLEAACELSSRVYRDLEYLPGATTVGTTPEDTLSLGRGVCQDFAHLAVGCLRSLGLAARYVSGYLVNEPHGAPAAALAGADASHAWLAVWTPEHGWVDLDPTNDLLPTDRHIKLAWGRDYGDVSPIKGVILGGGDHTIDVAVDVTAV
jgi:transglutaminase-like putative cysteine protease